MIDCILIFKRGPSTGFGNINSNNPAEIHGNGARQVGQGYPGNNQGVSSY